MHGCDSDNTACLLPLLWFYLFVSWPLMPTCTEPQGLRISGQGTVLLSSTALVDYPACRFVCSCVGVIGTLLRAFLDFVSHSFLYRQDSKDLQGAVLLWALSQLSLASISRPPPSSA